MNFITFQKTSLNYGKPNKRIYIWKLFDANRKSIFVVMIPKILM